MLKLEDIKIKVEKEKGNFARIRISPLDRGHGTTLGNSLRRVLLSSLRGAAITQIEFKGVPHQFTTIPGVLEDVVDLTLNFKEIRFKLEEEEPAAMKLEAKGEGEVTAGDITPLAGVEVVNEDLVLAHLTTEEAELQAEFLVEPGYGYSPSEEHPTQKVGAIAVDAVFSPVLRAAYEVEKTRKEELTGLDSLILEVETDGTITPLEALQEAAGILVGQFKKLSQGETKEEKKEKKKKKPKITKRERAYPVEELELPTRVTNALKKGRIKTVGGLLRSTSEGENLPALLDVSGVGEKSVKEIRKHLKARGWI